MSRDVQPTTPPNTTGRYKAAIEFVNAGDVALVNVSGLIDEKFAGFGDVSAPKIVILNVSGLTRMTSFGVRQWLNAMDALPKTITDLYLLGCPTLFVDQLNMVLNFGGASKVLTVVAPYTCTSCGVESGETLDVLAERATLSKGGLPEKECTRCGGKLEFDETPESYFAFANKYAASSIQPGAAQLLASLGLYTSADSAAEKPPRIIKLVHGSVTYFRIIGTIGSMFRARPFLVGAEGEVVIDLAEVARFDPAGQKEWRRLLKSLSGQVPGITLVDVSESFLANAGDSLVISRNISVASVLVLHRCLGCGRASHESETLLTTNWPRAFENHVCTTCGGITQSQLSRELLLPLQKASTSTLPASAKVIAQREEILSRALTDANVAQAGENASAAVTADDTILGKYKIVRRLSEGGMAEVFLAKQVGIGGFEKPVALKRIQRKLLETRHLAIDMFLNEAKIAGRLMHPNIVQVLDVGEVGGALYLAMEYVHGKDLRDVIKRLQQSRALVPLGEALHIVREVAQALDHAYWSTDMDGKRLAVVHRDVSPQNIILSYGGAVKLLDFGVAMSAVTEHAEPMIVGKWLYMSPETTLNQPIDHRSDLFSLGVILYLLCSGTVPFSGEPKEIVQKIRAGWYKPLHEVASVPERLATLVARMLAPNPEDRPQRGQEVVAEVTEIARQYGLERSSPQIAEFVLQVFPSEGDPDPKGEAVSSDARMLATGSLSPIRRTSSERSVVGTAPTPRQGYSEQLGVPGSLPTPGGMSSVIPVPRAHRQSVPPSSMSGSPSPVLMPTLRPVPPVPLERPTSIVKIIVIATIVIALAIAMYLLVQPN